MKLFIITLICIFLDRQTQEPLTGVEIKDTITNQSYYSDIDGKIEIYNDESCRYEISYISYKDTNICNSDYIVYLDVK